MICESGWKWLEATLPQLTLLVSRPKPQITWQIKHCDVTDDKDWSCVPIPCNILIVGKYRLLNILKNLSTYRFWVRCWCFVPFNYHLIDLVSWKWHIYSIYVTHLFCFIFLRENITTAGLCSDARDKDIKRPFRVNGGPTQCSPACGEV